MQYYDFSVVDSVTAAAGQQLVVECADYNSKANTAFSLGMVDAVLIAPASGSSSASLGASRAALATPHAPARLAG